MKKSTVNVYLYPRKRELNRSDIYVGIVTYNGDKPLRQYAVNGYSEMNRCEMLSLWNY